MKGSRVELEGYAAARACVILFVSSAFVSYVYVLITGTYNGDFYGVPEALGFFGQTGMLALALLPYAIGWHLYRYFKAKRPRQTIPIPHRRVTIVFFVVVIWFIVLVIKYDVGVLGQALYDAPALIKPLIQISNRINPFYLGVLFILTHQGSRKVLWLGIALLIALGILRAGLGVFLYVSLALLIRNYQHIAHYVRHHRLQILVVALVFPTIVGQLYSFRGKLRDDGSAEIVMSATQIVAARLVGRLSSFSNGALVTQETAYFKSEVNRLDPFYFEEQAFGGVFGVAFIPQVTPERMLVNIYGGDYFDVSFMVGLPGNLYLALLISPLIFILNVVIVLLMSVAVFVLSRKLRTSMANEFALLLLLYPLTSGVGNEFSSLIAALLSFCILFALLAIRVFPRTNAARRSRQFQIRASAPD